MLTRARAAVSRQLSNPTGRGGKVIALLMNRGNRDLNARAIELLDVTPASHVLDLGFGGGATLPVLLDAAAKVTGVDRAQDMVEAGRQRHRDAIAAGRLALLAGDVSSIPLGDASVDRILSVNTVYFWPDLAPAFAELRRILAPGGRVVLGIRDGSVMDQVDPAIFTIRAPGELTDALRMAGFVDTGVHSASDGRTHLVTAMAPSVM